MSVEGLEKGCFCFVPERNQTKPFHDDGGHLDADVFKVRIQA